MCAALPFLFFAYLSHNLVRVGVLGIPPLERLDKLCRRQPRHWGLVALQLREKVKAQQAGGGPKGRGAVAGVVLESALGT